MERFVQALRQFGIGRLGAIFGISAGVGVALFLLASNFGSPPMGLLYSGLDLKEAGEITQALDQAGIKYKAEGDGSTIMVARDQVGSTRMMLSSKGMPTQGSVGYEIFDNTNALGQTDAVTQLNRKRALEGELARTLRAPSYVTYAKVLLTLPERRLFEEEAAAPTASVTVGASRPFSSEQIMAMQHQIAAAVPNLTPARVAIIDQKSGRLLAGGDGEGSSAQMAEQRRNETEEAIRKKVMDQLSPSFPGKVAVSVTAELDLERVTEEAERFDPDGQVARQTQSITSAATEGQGGPNGEVSTETNLPGDTGGQSAAAGSNNNRTEETSNFEISKTLTTTVREAGAIKKLSVAVNIDGLTAAQKPGVEAMVRAAIGFNQERGDTVTVESLKFAAPPTSDGGVEAKSPLAAFDKNDIMRGAELGVLLVVAALIIFFVARPLLKASSGAGGVIAMPMLAGAGAGAGGPGQQILPGQATMAGGQITFEPGQAGAMQAAEDPRIDIARIEGQVKASAVKQVSDFVERHPEESVSILRSWLHEA